MRILGLPIADLREIFEAAGCTGARTHIQSGNVVYEGPSSGDAPIDRVVAAAIEERLGLRVPVVIIEAEAGELSAAVAGVRGAHGCTDGTTTTTYVRRSAASSTQPSTGRPPWPRSFRTHASSTAPAAIPGWWDSESPGKFRC